MRGFFVGSHGVRSNHANSPCREVRGAVSYTHLDVYKRQEHGFENTTCKNGASAYGVWNNASAVNSSAFGHWNWALAEGSSGFGYANRATGLYSSAFGVANLSLIHI